MNRKSNATSFERSITINAPIELVWQALTDIEQMQAWMGEPEMALMIEVEWAVGSPIAVSGVHHAPFQNTGMILAFEPPSRLAYTHLSSLSQLPDEPSNYTALEFCLAAKGELTSLTLKAGDSPTATIFKHLEFYWVGTLEALKRHVERW